MEATRNAGADGIERLDSRRLPGPHLVFDAEGAVIDARVPAAVAPALIAAWEQHLRSALQALEWPLGAIVAQTNPVGVSLAFAAPIDQLFAATEVNEWAFDSAVASLRGETYPALSAVLPAIRAAILDEASPALAALSRAADEQELCFLHDPGDCRSAWVRVVGSTRATVFRSPVRWIGTGSTMCRLP